MIAGSIPGASGDEPVHREPNPSGLRICVVGAGSRFLSGISYYTNRLIAALGACHPVSAILVRQMMPTRLYPGRARVGKALANFTYPEHSRIFDGIDWYWIPSIIRAIRLLRIERPDVVVFQWWTGTVLHSYLLLAMVSRALGARVVVEFHEVLDTAELQMPVARWYVKLCAPLFIRTASGFVVHNEFDQQALAAHYDIGRRPVSLVPHGPYDQYVAAPAEGELRDSSDNICHLLYFGVIRPFKGVEDIVEAFDMLSPDEAARFTLTIVGETWENWTVPAERIASSVHRERIRFVNHYVDDGEVTELFRQADAVVLPYHRSSASGPLHLAMASGLPVVVSAVGGLIEASEGYEGAILVPPRDPIALRNALRQVHAMRGRRFADVHSWDRTVAGYERLFAEIVGSGRVPATCP